MAIDQGLLDLAGRGTACLRLYRWHPSCLSFGRNEPAGRRYDRGRIEALGLDTVRRPTGGRAVWHADELTYAVACPGDRFGALATAYRTIHETIARALAELGVTVSLAGSGRAVVGLDAGACFGSPAGGEVMAYGRKVVGSAQLRHGDAMLQHGSVLLAGSQRIVERVTRGPAAPSLDAPLGQFLERRVTFDEIAEAIGDSARAWSGGWDTLDDPGEELGAAAPHLERFSSADWTWRR